MKIRDINVGDNLVYTDQYYHERHNVVVTKKERYEKDKFSLWLHLTDEDDMLPMGCVGVAFFGRENEEIVRLKLN